MKRKWFFVGVILILLAVMLISVRAQILAGFDLSWPALAGGGSNGQNGYHSLWGTQSQSSAGLTAVRSGLWGSASKSLDLSDLVFSTGALTPAFSPATTTYTQTVDKSTCSLTVTAEAVDPTSIITVNATPVTSGRASGSINLAYGSNTISIVVAQQAGVAIKTYTVTVFCWYKIFLPVIKW